ncbi:hypothetical protein GCM10011512_13880 [Tersicoccus solisilvae]|uniref:Acyltransferase 3 domain-containing protein n=1 Tax=Tersicoccus solisilvae TaxID=1882339 RepID=A0ABQ1NZW3_9MICC|nr:acyltransferase [Tersicoccus solisilvae]GGC88164.1 hypothetical protein GCM10011512_13880 [Tersicoccus solisilvae]
MAQPRSAWVDVTRGTAIVLVVFYHVAIALKVSHLTAPPWAVTLSAAVSPFRVPALMFCSGLFLTRSLARPPRRYLSGKLRRIGWPYLVWTTVIVAVLWAGSSTVGNGGYGPARIVALLVDPTTYTWYLVYLLAFYVLALGLPAAVRTALVVPLLAVSGVVHDGDGWSRLCFTLAFFLLGDVVGRHRSAWERTTRRPWAWAPAAAAFLTTAVVATLVPGLRYDVVSAVGVVGLVVVACPLGALVTSTLGGRVLTAIGRDSLIYYVTHWVLVTLAAHLVGRVPGVEPTVAVLVLLAAGLAGSWVMTRAARRFALVDALYTWPASRAEMRRPAATP